MTAASYRPSRPAAVEYRPRWEHVAFYLFIWLPFAAVVYGVVYAVEGRTLSWLTVALAVAFYVVTAHGITIGYHRLLTHRSFKAARPLKIALAIAGSMAIQGGAIRCVADHRKHHQHSDSTDDPHSPWRFGSGPKALARGLYWSHTGWLFQREQAVKAAYAPDLLADPDVVRIHQLFPVWVAVSVLAPPAIAFVATGSAAAAGSALLWASAVRIFLLHHVTFAINSICHVAGRRPFITKDRSTNFWPLAVLSMGESWHNLHHADPTCARHGVDRGQLDSSARLIAWFEAAGWARDVRWPRRSRLDTRRAHSERTSVTS
jgi:stearoyl-CoA desaturase (delta-9 desaturase)